jgi:hypothetical protein
MILYFSVNRVSASISKGYIIINFDGFVASQGISVHIIFVMQQFFYSQLFLTWVCFPALKQDAKFLTCSKTWGATQLANCVLSSFVLISNTNLFICF